MLSFSKISSRVFGSMVGFFSGALAGIKSGCNFWFSDIGKGDLAGLGECGLFILTLPFFMLYHMVLGVYEGATKGFMAGLEYLITFDEQPIIADNLIIPLLDKLIATPTETPLLTADEEARVNLLINSPDLSTAQRKALAEELNNYQTEINRFGCRLTKHKLSEIEKPIIVEVNKKNWLCDATAFKKLAQDCLDKKVPISFSQAEKPDSQDIISSNNIRSLGAQHLPKMVTDFVEKMRGLFFYTSAYVALNLGNSLAKQSPVIVPAQNALLLDPVNVDKVKPVNEPVAHDDHAAVPPPLVRRMSGSI